MKIRVVMCSLLFVSAALAQIPDNVQRYRADAKGASENRRQGIMDGNRIRTLFSNNGEVGRWSYTPSLEWLKGSGHQYLDGCTMLIAAEVTAPGNGQTIHPLEASYREEMPKDPVTGVIWGLEPVPGYANPSSLVKTPATSTDPTTWPAAWPAALGLSADWNGQWYGYFGRGVSRADFETFFVLDDSKDGKYQQAPYFYYPIASDSDRGGLGLRVEVRGFQWSDMLVEDVIFWNYDIVNIADRDYQNTCFGLYLDPGVGGVGSGNDDASYSTALDLCYAWDHAGKGDPAYGVWTPGYYGDAYMETPGNPYDGIDNDEDGIVDECRDDGIDNNHNWVGYEDVNKNGKWDPGEPLNNDVGADGLGPLDPQYTGPDQGEGDGIPTHGEPMFDETDKDESDQIGLTAVSLTPLSDKGPTGVWPKNNEVVWRKMTGGFVDTGIVNSNISIVMSSGPFPLKMGRRERYSMALIMGKDLSELVMKKRVAQRIYDNNFIIPDSLANLGTLHTTLISPTADAPISGTANIVWNVTGAMGKTTSTVYASGNDNDWSVVGVDESGKHTLAWDTSLFPDGIFYTIRIITIDAVGMGIAQSTAPLTVNNAGNAKPEIRWKNFKSRTTISGTHAIEWLGGDADGDPSIVNLSYKLASETKWTPIASKLNASAGAYQWDTKNIPNSSANDYQLKAEIVSLNDTATVTGSGFSIANTVVSKPGDPLITSKKTNGTGSLSVTIADAPSVTGHSYLLTFQKQTGGTVTGTITDVNTGAVILTNIGPMDGLHETKTFDGIRLSITSDKLEPDAPHTGWASGTSIFPITAAFDASFPVVDKALPYDYLITFSNVVVDTAWGDLDPQFIPALLHFSIKNITTNTKMRVLISDIDGSNTLTKGDEMLIPESINDDIAFTWKVKYGMPESSAAEPTLGDTYLLKTKKPFAEGDSITFTTLGLTNVEKVSSAISSEYMLAQNFPNPFNPSTTIAFNLPRKTFVSLKIFDLIGREVEKLVSEELPPGSYQRQWNASGRSSGVYFYRMQAGAYTETKRLVILR
jgi:hypothetical protein